MPPIEAPTAVKTQLQQEDVHSPQGGMNLECPAQVIRKAVPPDPIGHLLHKATLQAQEIQQLYLIHRNRQREAAKMRRQEKKSPK